MPGVWILESKMRTASLKGEHASNTNRLWDASTQDAGAGGFCAPGHPALCGTTLVNKKRNKVYPNFWLFMLFSSWMTLPLFIPLAQ